MEHKKTQQVKIGRYPVDETFVGERYLVLYFAKTTDGYKLLKEMLRKNYHKN